MNHFIEALKKYAVFKGKSSRKQFWYFILFYLIFSILFSVLDAIITKKFLNYELLSYIYKLAMLTPLIAITVRRFHDANKNGWMVLYLSIPYIILMGVLLCFMFYIKTNSINDFVYFIESNMWLIIITTILSITSLIGSIWMLIILLKKGVTENNEAQQIKDEIKDDKKIIDMNNKQQKISLPLAIVAAGFMIMIAILITNNPNNKKEEQTLSEQVGVSKDDLSKCMESTDTEILKTRISLSLSKALSNLPQDKRGTPYTIIIGPNNTKAEIYGYTNVDNLKEIIKNLKNNKIENIYTGKVEISEEEDRMMGSKDAKIKIIEYSDFECPYCKLFHSELEELVKSSGGEISWTFRHWPIHSGSFEKVMASECVAKIKGDKAFFEYSKLIFSLLKTEEESFSDKL